jgi:hypothetical protein
MSNYNASIQSILQQLNTFPISSSTNADWNMYSINELSFYESNATTIPNDNLSNAVEQRQMVLGSLIFTELDDPTSYTIQHIRSPVGFYVDCVYGNGKYDINGVYTPSTPFDLNANNTITMHILSVSVYLQRGGQTVSLANSPTVSYNFTDLVINCNQFSNGHTPAGQYYGIQYVGMLDISNLIIPVVPSATYDIGVTITYSYDHSHIQKFDAFQSGLFVNLTDENRAKIIAPFYFDSSGNTNYSPGEFIPV